MLVYLHGDISCVQQDMRLHYHKSNHDHYFIPHTVAQTAPTEVGENESKCNAHKVSRRYRESSKAETTRTTFLLSCLIPCLTRCS